jgi:hypothetical protein
MLNCVNLDYKNNYNITLRKTAKVNNCPPVNRGVSFGNTLPNAAPAAALRTQLSSKEEKAKYKELIGLVDPASRKPLHTMLKSGVLLNNNSNDRSTVLDNLYKIAQNPRAHGLSNRKILHETIQSLANPFVVTQQLGDIPAEYKRQAGDVSAVQSGTCVAASAEFNMAIKQPAEFARFVEGLSSPTMSVEKTIKLSNLADNTLDAVWLLNAFEIPYEARDFDSVKVKFAPDKNALLRAQIQTTHHDPGERSSIDVLMQSTFMQVGSQQSYDSLPDKRAGKFNQNDKGLIEFEKTFLESIMEDKNKISVTYQIIDETGKLVGYETDFGTIKKHITDTLALGENLIIGYTQVDAQNRVVNGHEITIIGTRTDKSGKMIFICNDTDDEFLAPIEYGEDFLLPKIHHTALPKEIAQKDVQMVESWVECLRSYKDMKKR